LLDSTTFREFGEHQEVDAVPHRRRRIDAQLIGKVLVKVELDVADWFFFTPTVVLTRGAWMITD